MNKVIISKKDWDFLSVQLSEYSEICEGECQNFKYDKKGFMISAPDKKSSGWSVHKKIERLLKKYYKQGF